MLSTSELGKLLRGKERVRAWLRDFIRDEIETRACMVCADCEEPPDSTRCLKSFKSLLELVVRWTTWGGVDEADPLRMLGILEREEDHLRPLVAACESCKEEFMDVVVYARRECWDCLSTWFELPEVDGERFETYDDVDL